MTLGDKPDIGFGRSRYAHPITGKIWMKKLDDSEVEIFEDGYTIFFDEFGSRTDTQKYSDQSFAVEHLARWGYRIV